MNVKNHIAIFVPSLRGGGAERVMVDLACGFVERGYSTDLVLAKAEGPYLKNAMASIRVIDLNSPRVFSSIIPLARYLRRERPKALLSAMTHANISALWAARLAGVSTRIVVSERNTLSQSARNTVIKRQKIMPRLVRIFYPWADGIVAVSGGVADDLYQMANLPRNCVTVIYNPVVTTELLAKSTATIDHPWFAPGEPPVVLGAGRLSLAKDFPTLIKAFAKVCSTRPARLIILGQGDERAKLEALVKELKLESNVMIPGFVQNPFVYMRRSAVFVLSSAWEGLPGTLIQAMACGCPVVSTNCPSGPAEILEHGRYGPLISVGDERGLADAILATLQNPPDPEMLNRRSTAFSLDKAIDSYLDILINNDAPCYGHCLG